MSRCAAWPSNRWIASQLPSRTMPWSSTISMLAGGGGDKVLSEFGFLCDHSATVIRIIFPLRHAAAGTDLQRIPRRAPRPCVPHPFGRALQHFPTISPRIFGHCPGGDSATCQLTKSKSVHRWPYCGKMPYSSHRWSASRDRLKPIVRLPIRPKCKTPLSRRPRQNLICRQRAVAKARE